MPTHTRAYLHDAGAQEALRLEAQHLLAGVGEADERDALLLVARLNQTERGSGWISDTAVGFNTIWTYLYTAERNNRKKHTQKKRLRKVNNLQRCLPPLFLFFLDKQTTSRATNGGKSCSSSSSSSRRRNWPSVCRVSAPYLINALVLLYPLEEVLSYPEQNSIVSQSASRRREKENKGYIATGGGGRQVGRRMRQRGVAKGEKWSHVCMASTRLGGGNIGTEQGWKVWAAEHATNLSAVVDKQRDTAKHW